MNAIFHRVSIRKYLNQSVEQEKIELIACGYPAEERPQEDRYEAERVHYMK